METPFLRFLLLILFAPRPRMPASSPTSKETSPALATDLTRRVIANVEQAIVGKRKQLVLSMVAWLSGGHLLL
jgi:MoxR-like ATPase